MAHTPFPFLTARRARPAHWLALLALGACGEVREPDAVDEPRDEVLEESHASDELDQQAVDELMALPYAGYVEDDEESAALEGLVAFDRERSSPGYTLLSVFSLGMALLIDHEGEIVHHWRAPEPSRWEHVELLESGEILTTVMIGRDENSGGNADEDRYGLRMTWAGEVVSTVRSPVHHQMTRDRDGRLVALSAAWRMERLPGWGEQRRKFPLRDNPVAFFDESGEPVRSVSLFDMIAAAPERFPIQVTKKDGDLLHTNSIDWTHRPELADRSPVYGPNCAVISMRHQDRIAVFDLEQEELIWAWGLGELSGPHDVQLLENGRFIVLDNGVAQERSRVVEVDPLEGEIAWEWQAPEPADFYTRSKGSVQRLPNGNTLIGNADSGEAFEITHGGDVVWRYLSPLRDDKGRRATLHRARRYDTAFIDGLIAQHGARPYEP